MPFPGDLITVLNELTSMKDIQDHSLRVIASFSARLLANEDKPLPYQIELLGMIRKALNPYRKDTRLRFLHDHIIAWHRECIRRNMDQYNQNPMVMQRTGRPYEFVSDETIGTWARGQGFTADEEVCIKKEMSTRWEHVNTPFQGAAVINSVGRTCITPWSPPRMPLKGDRVWYFGLGRRENALEVVEVTQGNRAVQTSDGRLHETMGLTAIRSYWHPFVPEAGYPILWWDRAR